MGNVVPFLDRPMPIAPTLVDDNARTMQKYTLSYAFGESTWSIHVWAYSFDDAEARVEAMRCSLRLDGTVEAIIDAPWGLK